ncbi:flagellar hook-basal body protein [Bacillus velezensis]|uniref:flagellar hook-basal body protein n=1 Tax=Bacillus velezensis TaxID=492670 RepID=UPI0007B6CD64|nr:flagellar hook-basal body protein [Bacillus velezensis]ANB85320.1 flagellar biosynthesis protein FlgC [Bacillus velezensis]PRS90038.1 flagellar biosynthesis protein FlgC [Bacillus velezensis]
MLKGLYTATSAMITQQRRTEMLSNNIANANTSGYKEDQGSIRAFPEMLLSRIEGDKKTKIGSVNTGVYMQELKPLFTQGSLKTTDQPTDIALMENQVPKNAETNENAELFYPVQTAGGVRYSKSSTFSLNENNQLTINGNLVLSTNGQPITVDNEKFTVSENGTVTTTGRPAGQIDIRMEEDVRNLKRDGNDLYSTADGSELPSAAANPQVSYSLKQGVSELSNVDVTSTYTEMTEAYRSFEANQKVIQAYDKSMDKAANEIGKV